MPRFGDQSDFVIIGGVAAGPKTAATLARRLPRASITLFQKGKYLSYASCGLPYFASGDVENFKQLTQTPFGIVRDADFFAAVKGFTAITGAEVTAIDRKKKNVAYKLDGESAVRQHGYGKLVLATGGRPASPPFTMDDSPRIRSFTRPEDAVTFRKLAETGQLGTAIVIGGGYIGCELAEAMGGLWGITTTLVEKEEHALSTVLDPEMSRLVEQELQKQSIDLRLGSSVDKISGKDKSAAVHLAGGETLEAGFVIICVGVVPETTLAQKCGLTIGPTGAIAVNDHLQTSDPDIYAGGDCVELNHRITGEQVYVPLGSLANRHGWVIAENLAGNATVYPGVLGTFLVKVFDLNVGGVGLNSVAAGEFAQKYATVWGSFVDRPDYYPESKPINLKMIYDEADGRLLGLQAVGEGDIARRIDTFAGFLQFKATLSDLLSFEHGYAPPYSEAVDPLHHLAGIARAGSRGFSFAGPLEIGHESAEGLMWLDVREPEEQESAPLDMPGVVKIPLNRLRAGLPDLPKNRKIVIVCQRGSRAYQAAVILRDAGFENVVVLGGGKAMLG